jgi:hypothetical protein
MRVSHWRTPENLEMPASTVTVTAAASTSAADNEILADVIAETEPVGLQADLVACCGPDEKWAAGRLDNYLVVLAERHGGRPFR